MKCPICGAAANPTDLECECGEMLAAWRSIALAGEGVRQRGLVLAEEGDYLGACISFLEATLANPMDKVSLVDAAKSLFHLERVDDAQRLLAFANSRAADCGAKAVSKAIREILERQTPPEQGRDSQPGGATATVEKCREFLAFEPLTQSGGWLPFLRNRQPVDPMWTTVLRMERNWNGDWGGLTGWLDEAAGQSGHYSVVNYMLGLVAWQRNDFQSAKNRFRTCLKQSPPFLNPAAYFLCLHLNELDSASKVETRLREKFGPRDVARIVGLLEERLTEWDDKECLQSLENLKIKRHV